ncbi:MAG: hypothetical protein K2M69_00555 [Muribaculaceae bacterium]|nr:hypothetical protein [Muribaculaceae bacterium]
MTGINFIKETAHNLGACGRMDSINSVNEAVELFMSPQGREFALKTGFPTYEIWRSFYDSLDEDAEPRINDIYILVDSVKTILHNQECIVIGNSNITIDYSDQKRLYHVIAMHGAAVEIHASDYAVVTVTNIKSTVKIINDGTAEVTVEQM